jgi:serine/threonine-protein kinase TNNI3K
MQLFLGPVPILFSKHLFFSNYSRNNSNDSLTLFLESSPQPVPYHIQINLNHDITLALSFLHSNGIVHRDLSSNDVPLRGNVLAKVIDFEMARLGDQNP